jgi:hypothetical protein
LYVCVSVCVSQMIISRRERYMSEYTVGGQSKQDDEEICVMASDDFCFIANITTVIIRSTLRLVGEET